MTGRRLRLDPSRAPRVLLFASAVSAGVATLPLLYLVVRISQRGFGPVLSVLQQPRTWEVATNSVLLAVAVAATCLVVGVPAAWLTSRTTMARHRGWLVGLALPLAIPSYVAAYAWVGVFPELHGFTGAWLVLSLASLPYVILPVAAAFATADAGQEHAARTLGLGPFQTFMRASLPQAMPAAAAGSLLAALYALSDFGTVAIMRYDAFSRVIYSAYRSSFDRTSAAVLALLLVMLAIGFVVAEQASRGSARRFRVGSAVDAQPARANLGRWTFPAVAALAVLIILSIVVPFASLTRLLVTSKSAGIDWNSLVTAAGATAAVSVAGAVVAVGLAFPIAFLAARYRSRVARVLETAAFAGHVLPGVVVGLSLIFLSLAWLPWAYQSVAILALAYGILFLPKAAGSMRTAFASVPPELENVARASGLTARQTLSRVTLPIAWPGVLAGGTLAMVTAMKELPATLMLRPTGMETLATRMWRETDVSNYASAAPYAVALLLVAAVPAAFLARTVDSSSETPTPAAREAAWA